VFIVRRTLLVRVPSQVTVHLALLPLVVHRMTPLCKYPYELHSADLRLSFDEFQAVWYGPSDWQSVGLKLSFHECPALCPSYELCYGECRVQWQSVELSIDSLFRAYRRAIEVATRQPRNQGLALQFTLFFLTAFRKTWPMFYPRPPRTEEPA
jgi:hypothetical protein